MSIYNTPEKLAAHAAEQRRYRRRHGKRIYEERVSKNYERLLHVGRKWRRQPGRYAAKSRRARLAHPEKKAAWDAVFSAIKKGRLVRPELCEECYLPCRPQAHHPDYKKKLDIVWLCRACHLATEGKQARVWREGDAHLRLRYNPVVDLDKDSKLRWDDNGWPELDCPECGRTMGWLGMCYWLCGKQGCNKIFGGGAWGSIKREVRRG